MSITVMWTGRPDGGPKNGPVAVPRAWTRDPDGVAGFDRVLDGEAHVRGGGVDLADRLLDVGDGLGAGAGHAELVLDQVGGAQLVDDVGVAGGEAFVEDPLQHVGRPLCDPWWFPVVVMRPPWFTTTALVAVVVHYVQ